VEVERLHWWECGSFIVNWQVLGVSVL
jgi:hypothetical protein